MNGWDVVLIALLVALLGLAVWSVLRRKKAGGCCGDCSSCAGCARCSGRGKKR